MYAMQQSGLHVCGGLREPPITFWLGPRPIDLLTRASPVQEFCNHAWVSWAGEAVNVGLESSLSFGGSKMDF